MPKIELLDATVADQIAAGEVVERPSSVVKELVENALDAGAARLRVEVERGGRALMRVADDGEGMDAEDLGRCVLRHATSKIRRTDDLLRLGTFGYRGEALPSIASVSRLRLTTRARGAPAAWSLDVEGGRSGQARPAARAEGTTVEVRGLFYNTPARLKFLKSDATECSRIVGALSQMALACPRTALELVVDSRVALDLPAGAPEDRLAGLWGPSLAAAALKVEGSSGEVAVRGWVAPPQFSRGQRGGQWLYVNGRVVEHRQLGFHLSQAFGSLLPHGRHAVAALFLEAPSDQVDVNVHPAKREVRFRDEAGALDCLRHAVARALRDAHLFATVDLGASGRPGGEGGSPLPQGSGGAGSGGAAGGAFPPGVQGYGVFSEAQAQGWGGAGAPGGQMALVGRTAETAQPGHTRPQAWVVAPPAALPPDWPQPLAQLHRSYLLCQDAQGLVIVDQHAAHERVLYERQLALWAKGGVTTQRLLLPQRFQCTPDQADRLEGHLSVLEGLGVELQNVGGGTFFVTTLPEYMKHVQVAGLLTDLLHPGVGREAQPLSGDPVEDFRREAAAGLACRAAVKAGDPLIWEAMQQLMADLSACRVPWCCPHGRPPLVRVSLAELEKYFQRR